MLVPSDYFQIIVWINIHLCFPLTFLAIPLCFMVRLDHIPVSYYINLLISNLMLIITLVSYAFSPSFYYYGAFMHRVFLSYLCSGVTSSCFRMIFAVERFLSLYRPQIHFIRKTKGFVTFCVLAWILCIVLCTILISFPSLAGPISLIFAAIMFIICLAVTLKSLCVASSESAEEKYRVVGALVLLLVNYIFLILPMIDFSINLYFRDLNTNIFFTLSLHCPVIDFLLLGFMSKGPFIRLLMRLCCCRKTNPAENDSSRSDAGL
ncbi:uncharacterized protein LOC103477171 [Poecilia reticulata]|uniref:uncharacterized protein LOC103477171 n=1 Tax=Poecilia reticulata TaxID=8081 RepID=UPI0004A2E4F4|nr:PREDICTED: uncharacterized protein LOC103477171 [Poecilia reticulata]